MVQEDRLFVNVEVLYMPLQVNAIATGSNDNEQDAYCKEEQVSQLLSVSMVIGQLCSE